MTGAITPRNRESSDRSLWGRVWAIRRLRVDWLARLWYAGLFLAGMWLVMRSSPWGIGVRVDSISYLTAAQSLSEGDCLCRLGSGMELKPLIHFGPAYPSLLAGLSLLGLPVLEAARWVNAAVFGGLLVLGGLAVHLTTQRFWAGALTTLLLGASPVIVEVHDSAMSEPLFLLLLVVAFLSLSRYLTFRKRADLVVATVASALALLTRYMGGSLVVAGLAALLLYGGPPLRQRIREASLYALGAVLPTALWGLRGYLLTGSATNRVAGYHPVNMDDLRTFLDTVSGWITSTPTSHWLEGAVLGAVVAGAAAVVLRQPISKSQSLGQGALLGRIALLFIAVYVPLLAVSRSFFDASNPIDDRMLSPWYAALALLAGVVYGIAARSSPWRWVGLGIGLLFFLGPGRTMIRDSQHILARLERDGVGFASRAWRESESMSWVRSLSPESLLYSNNALGIQFLLGRAAYGLPERYDPVKAERRQDFLEQLAGMQAALEQPESYLLVFDPARPVLPEQVEDEFTVGLVPILLTNDGVVFAKGPNRLAVGSGSMGAAPFAGGVGRQ